DAEIEELLFGVGRLQPLGDEVVERVLDEWLDEVVVDVVALGVVGAGRENQAPFARVLAECRPVLQQPLVDRAEFLDIERGIVHADELAIVGALVEAERAETTEEDVVREHASGQGWDGVRLEQLASERRETELLAGAFGLEEP